MKLFDIIGPIMVGPSSSHTAGAVKIGNVCTKLLDEEINAAEILLHGSFLSTGKGHGTDKALVAGLLGMEVDNIDIPRSFELAEEKGMTLKEVIEAAKNDDSYDKYVDKHQVELALKESCVLGSRLAIWMLKEADLKVYLYASDETRAGRVFNREGGDLQQIKDFTAMRDREDTGRYKAFYGIDNNDYNFVDIIVDVNDKTPEEIVDIIIEKLVEKNLIEK